MLYIHNSVSLCAFVRYIYTLCHRIVSLVPSHSHPRSPFSQCAFEISHSLLNYVQNSLRWHPHRTMRGRHNARNELLIFLQSKSPVMVYGCIHMLAQITRHHLGSSMDAGTGGFWARIRPTPRESDRSFGTKQLNELGTLADTLVQTKVNNRLIKWNWKMCRKLCKTVFCYASR